MISVARYLTARIEELGVSVVPVLQGGVIMKMIDEVGQSKSLEYVVPNHEQALAMMVDGQARLTGYGVGFATSGPGAVNLATGIACAFYDSVPCMFITGQVGTFHLRKQRKVRQRGFQETDVVALMGPITKYASQIENAEDARFEFEKALYLSRNGRPGPVLLDLPYDVQRKMIDPESLDSFTPPVDEGSRTDISLKSELILRALRESTRPLVLIGGGVRIANSDEGVRRFLETSGIPVVSTWSAADIVSRATDQYLGNIGKSGDARAVNAVQQCDLLLCFGSRFTPKVIINEKNFASQAKVIAVDIDGAELSEGIINPDEQIKADLRVLVPELNQKITEQFIPRTSWHLTLAGSEQARESEQREDKFQNSVNPYLFSRQLIDAMDDDGVVFADTGANLTWLMQGAVPRPGQRIISAWGNSPMGYSVPAAVGGKIAAPGRQIVATIGDGGFQMNIQELQTIVGNRIDIKVFIFNNRCLGNIKMGASREFDSRVHGNDAETGYTTPDFVKVATAYGLKTASIRSDGDIQQVLTEVLNCNEAVIVDVNIHQDQEHEELSLNTAV